MNFQFLFNILLNILCTKLLAIRTCVHSKQLRKPSYSLRAIHLPKEAALNFYFFQKPVIFLVRAGLIGASTGLGVVTLKNLIYDTQGLLYESLANILPKPVFYWPIALFPLVGSTVVTIIATLYGPTVWNGIDYIAKSIDGDSLAADAPSTELYFNVEDDSKEKIRIVESQQANYSLSLPMSNEQSIFPVTSAAIVIMNKVPTSEVFSQPSFNNVSTKSFGKIISKLNSIDPPVIFEPLSLVMRLIAAAGTLGSGCSLGPEGPSVELGAGFSRVFADPSSRTTSKEKHHLFLAGTAAGVAAGFGAPIAGVFFALECGNRILAKNTIKLEEDASDAPRADIAAIVLSATMSNIMVQLFLQHRETLFIQGNNYSMQSPFFELPIYLGLSIISGLISVSFELLRDIFKSMYKRIKVPKVYRPLLGGLLCGIAAIYYPQTLFNGYSTLEELLSTRTMLNDMSDFTLIVQLLGLKIILSSFSLASGLIGGVFAPSLFLGAAAVSSSQTFDISPPANPATIISQLLTFFSVSTTQAYATVGAAATLGALFRAPLTSAMLMFELTQNHDIVLPVLFSTGLAGFFAELLRKWFKDTSIEKKPN